MSIQRRFPHIVSLFSIVRFQYACHRHYPDSNQFCLSLQLQIRTHLLPFILALNFPEHLNPTTLLAPNVKFSPVAGFLPLLSLFSFTQNFPNPVIRTSSPFSSVFLMISIIDSTAWTERFFGRPSWFWIEPTRCALVKDIGRTS